MQENTATRMSRIWRHIVNIIFGTLLTGALTAAYFLGAADRKPILCKGLAITITDSTTNQFITPKEIRAYLDKEYKGYIGQPLDSIDLTRIEKILDSKSAVLKSEAYTTKDSMLNVTVTQRKPIVRFQKGGKGFYADSEGILFPLQSTYSSHVQVVDGEIPLRMESGRIGSPDSPKEKMWLEQMLGLIRYIETDRTWRNKIVQITVNRDGDLLMIPREGEEIFIFGTPTDIEEKFRKMELYYKGICREKGRNHYKHIDLRYDGQIVCRQNKE